MVQIVEKLQALAQKKNITPAQLAIAWVAAQGSDIIPIPGTKTIPRLEENWASRDVVFTDEELKEIMYMCAIAKRVAPRSEARVGIERS